MRSSWAKPPTPNTTVYRISHTPVYPELTGLACISPISVGDEAVGLALRSASLSACAFPVLQQACSYHCSYVCLPLIDIMERPTCLPSHSIWHGLCYLNSASFRALFILFLCVRFIAYIPLLTLHLPLSLIPSPMTLFHARLYFLCFIVMIGWVSFHSYLYHSA